MNEYQVTRINKPNLRPILCQASTITAQIKLRLARAEPIVTSRHRGINPPMVCCLR